MGKLRMEPMKESVGKIFGCSLVVLWPRGFFWGEMRDGNNR